MNSYNIRFKAVADCLKLFVRDLQDLLAVFSK